MHNFDGQSVQGHNQTDRVAVLEAGALHFSWMQDAGDSPCGSGLRKQDQPTFAFLGGGRILT